MRTLKPYNQYKGTSGDWFGKIPSHWNTLPHRALYREIKVRECPDEELLSVTIDRGVIRQSELLANSIKKDSSNEDKSKYKLVDIGDIVYNKMRAWQGSIGASRFRGIVSPAYVVVRLRDGFLPRYFHYLLRTPLFAREAQRWSYGISSDQWSLRWEDFKKIYSCVPPKEDQELITRFLQFKDTQLQQTVASYRTLVGVSKSVAERKASLLFEYRTRLIADITTGKYDVREFSATLPMPEGDPEEELYDGEAEAGQSEENPSMVDELTKDGNAN